MGTGPSHTWRYVASRSRVDGGTLWEIRELYPTEDGGFGYTANAIATAAKSPAASVVKCNGWPDAEAVRSLLNH